MQHAPMNELAEVDDNVAPSRQRLFIARQACERCRAKKSRCDGGDPCGQCQDAGTTCVFGDRKATKNEISLGMVFNALHRIETKVERALRVSPQAINVSAKRRRSLSGGEASFVSASPVSSRDDDRHSHAPSVKELCKTSPLAEVTLLAPPHRESIPYAVRQTLLWPAVRAMLGNDRTVDDFFHPRYATTLEQQRPPFPPPQLGAVSADGMAWLRISSVKSLADSYFATFNLANPVLDRKLFSQQTLGTAINSAFGFNIESCVTLVVMALGSFGQHALREGRFSSAAAETPDINDLGVEDGIPGLAFFNEARKRIGFLSCENSIHSCQFYLLSGLFFSQLLRPVDWWTMVNRATLCCTSFWEIMPQDCSEWVLDMQSRLFWNTVMHEAVLSQEFDVPVSNLLQYEDRVPLPRFIEFPGMMFAQTVSAETQAQEAVCQYHFLAQIAHRIILTRVRNTMFATPGNKIATLLRVEDYPSRALEEELIHQFDQWRQKLPPSLQWNDQEDVPPSTTSVNVLVAPWLRSRYHIARYHLRRPLFHRVLHHPGSITDNDIAKCKEALSCAMVWSALMKPPLTVKSCLPLRFFICTQFTGMIAIIEALGRSPDVRVKQLVPDNYGTWRAFALDTIKDCVALSPAVARDYEVVMQLISAP